MALTTRHTRASSRHISQQAIPPRPTPTHSGLPEWTKTAQVTCTRVVASTAAIYARDETCSGITSDGYALMLSAEVAFIFPYNANQAVPPILEFPVPPGESALLGALVPGRGQEPGLLVVMPTRGLIGFWPTLHSALATSSGIEAQLTLSSGESVVHLCNAGAPGLVLATSSGRLVHVTLRDAAGKPVVQLTSMSASNSWFGLSALRNLALRREIVNVKAGLAKSREEREVLVITRQGGLTLWEVARGGNYRSGPELDLSTCLSTEGMSEVLDVASYTLEPNAVLVLIRTREQTVKLVCVQYDVNGTQTVLRSFHLAGLDGPSLHVPNPGQVAFVQTRSSVHLVHLESGTVEEINCKEGVSIAGVGTEDQLKNKGNAAMILLTEGAGVLRLEVSGLAANAAEATRTRLEQAVFFGRRKDNPLDFEPAPADADQAALALSKEILRGTAALLPRHINLHEALKERLSAVHYLARYIQENAQPATKQQLRQDVEKIAAGLNLWTVVDQGANRSKLMLDLIQSKDQQNQDPVRHFFFRQLSNVLVVVLEAHTRCVEKAALLDPSDLAATLSEYNELILAVLVGAVEHREAHQALYADDGTKWTSRPEVLKTVRIQFEVTATVITNLAVHEGEALRNQLVAFATLNCKLYEEAIVYEPELRAEYHTLRAKWLQRLVDCGKAPEAFTLGEQIRDFETLVRLVHEQGEQAQDHETEQAMVRQIEWYLQKHQYDFAQFLWQHYLDKRQYRNLLVEYNAHREYVTKFFEDGKRPDIAWLNDVILGEFEKAGRTLLRIDEPKLRKRQIQLSIAKLALMVDGGVPTELSNQLVMIKIMRQRANEAKELAAGTIDQAAGLELLTVNLLDGAPTGLRGLLRRLLAKMMNGLELDAREAIEYLTSIRTASHFQALQILSAAALPSAHHQFLEKLIWRRCYIADDWRLLEQRAKNQSDATIETLARETALYRLVRDVEASDSQIAFLPAAECFYHAPSVPSKALSAAEQTALAKQYVVENEKLDAAVAQGLQQWIDAITTFAQGPAITLTAAEDQPEQLAGSFVEVAAADADVAMDD